MIQSEKIKEQFVTVNVHVYKTVNARVLTSAQTGRSLTRATDDAVNCVVTAFGNLIVNIVVFANNHITKL